MVENNFTLISLKALANELKHSKSNTFEHFLFLSSAKLLIFSNFAHELSIKLFKKDCMLQNIVVFSCLKGPY